MTKEEMQEQIDFLEKLLLASHGPDWVKMSQFDCEQKAKKYLKMLNDTKEENK
jgi:hypothetical protein